jgi:hypothetical protein
VTNLGQIDAKMRTFTTEKSGMGSLGWGGRIMGHGGMMRAWGGGGVWILWWKSM